MLYFKLQIADGSWHSGCTGTVSLQAIQTRLLSGCALAHIRQKHNTKLWITFNNLDPFSMLGFNWLCFPGWCAGNGKVSDNFGEHPCTVLVSRVYSITIIFSRGWYLDEPCTLTFIVYLFDENENGHGRIMWLRSGFACFRGFRFAGLPNPSTNHVTVVATTQGAAVRGVEF